MGLLFSRLYDALMGFYGLNARILFLGLDGAGKTTILYRLKLNETVATIPTIGFNVETLQPERNVTFTVWDVNAQCKMRPLWRHFFADTDGLVFVVDSADSERFNEVKFELETVLQHDDMTGVPFVVLANKQDLPGAKQPLELTEELGLRKLTRHNWHVQGCCATNGNGLVEGLEKLTEMVKEHKKTRRL